MEPRLRNPRTLSPRLIAFLGPVKFAARCAAYDLEAFQLAPDGDEGGETDGCEHL